MQKISFAFPDIDPVAIALGPISIRWYGIAYLISLLLAIIYIKKLVNKKKLWKHKLNINSTIVDDLGFYVFLGIFFGGRIGYILFYNLSYFINNPVEIFFIWNGGMSIHGGILFSSFILLIFSYYNNIYYRHIFDLASAVLPIGLLIGRIANFINGELYGYISNVPWAVRFPSGGNFPRHPSQLYEAALEGLLILIILNIMIWRFKCFKFPGFITGLFGIIYSISRIFIEFFRVPDIQIGYYFEFITQGMILSIPIFLLGIYFLMTSGLIFKRI